MAVHTARRPEGFLLGCLLGCPRGGAAVAVCDPGVSFQLTLEARPKTYVLLYPLDRIRFV